MVPGKQNLLGMTAIELSAFVEAMGEQRFRGRQLFGWLYEKGVSEFRAMSDLGKTFRERLDTTATIQGIALTARRVSSLDGTMKFLFTLADGAGIETVLIPPSSSFQSGAPARDEQQRLTLCVSTQAGCGLDCAFCATGTMGFSRNLTAGEIIDQVRQVRARSARAITNVVFMGMGEPLMNYHAVKQAAEILTEGIRIAARRITVSTAGWVPGIRAMADDRRRNKLAVSLHSAVDGTRSAIMPINRRFGLNALIAALEYYYRNTRQRVTFEVILFDGVNDTDHEVGRLIRLAKRVPSKINVIPFHPIEFTRPAGLAASLRPSPHMSDIVNRLRGEHLTVMVRSSAGEDIEAACGQLAAGGPRRHEHRPPLHTGSVQYTGDPR